MAGRPKIFDDKEILQKAIKVFWDKGYEAASTEELLTAMGIGKGSFYLAFKDGKRELYEKSLEYFANHYHTQLRADIQKSANPVEFIKQFFLNLTDESERKQAQGCYLGNGLIETSTKDPHTKKVITSLMAGLEEIFTETLRDAQTKKLLRNKTKPEILGRYLLNLWNGINITRRMYPKDASLKEEIMLSLNILN